MTNNTCLDCGCEIGNIENLSLVRTYTPKDSKNPTIHALGYEDDTGHFQSVYVPNFDSSKYDLVEDDCCIGCITKTEKMLIVPLHDVDDVADSFALSVKADFIRDCIMALAEIMSCKLLETGSIRLGDYSEDNSYLLLLNDSEPSLEVVKDEDNQPDGYSAQRLKLIASKSGTLCFAVFVDSCAHCTSTTTAPFRINHLLKLADQDVIEAN